MEILNNILAKIKQYETIIIHGHRRPDGDCYGAQFGLKNVIETSFPEKEVYVVGEKSDFVSFIGTVDTIEDDKYKDALSIVVDTATKDRISDQRYTLGREVIKIDHHIPVDDYGDMRWVDTTFPSCAQMIAFFYKSFDELKITEVGANAMYTGIVTDTGRFRYRGVSRLTHEIAGMLIEDGADIVAIDQNLSNESLDSFKFKAALLSKINFDEGFAYVVIKKDDYIKHNVSEEDAAANVNLLSGIAGYDVWMLLIETDEEVRVRIRSANTPISALANQFNGGGHQMASGAKLNNFDELEGFLQATRDYIKNI